MRASRLLSILTTLQARGQVTAPELAEACEVSVRTIYRDIDALAAAGIPVYADRGAEGGYRLLDGYRVRLNGLSQPEAEALFMTGLPGPAAALGLDAAMLAAQTKLMAALPANLRPNAGRMQERFHLDAPSWFGEAEAAEASARHCRRGSAREPDRDPLPELEGREAPSRRAARSRAEGRQLVSRRTRRRQRAHLSRGARSRLQRSGRALRSARRFRSRRLLASRDDSARSRDASE